MNYLISYNRSGNTWVRYILEYLTHQPTWGHQKFAISQRFTNSPIILTSDEPIIVKRHEIIPNEITVNDKVIFLLRDYKECIWNSMGCKYDSFEKEYLKYIQLLEFFHNFKGDKRLFYYDDIFQNYHFIFNLLYFLNRYDDIEKIIDFVDDIEIHKSNCFGVYKNSINTKDNEKVNLTETELNFIDDVMIKNGESSYLWSKYFRKF